MTKDRAISWQENERARTVRGVQRAILYALVVLYTLFTIGPVAWTVLLSLRVNKEIIRAPFSLSTFPRWANYSDLFGQSKYLTYYGNSVLIVVPAIFVGTIIAAMAGYCLARFRFTGREFIYWVFFTSILIPPALILVPLYRQLVAFHMINTRWGLGMLYMASSIPFATYILRSYFVTIPPDLADAAKIDGCNEWSTFWRVMLPVAMPGVWSLATFSFLLYWNEFLYAVVFIQKDAYRTLPLGIQYFRGQYVFNFALISASVTLASLPVIIFYAIFSEQIIKSFRTGAVKA